MSLSTESLRVDASTMEATFTQILLAYGMTQTKAQTCARIFTSSSLDGVYTHGVNRFPRFVDYIKKGHVKINNEPVCRHRFNGIEQWDGQCGPGPLNAIACTNRAMELAAHHGIGCVALANTNHWMRGGTYGWEAARKGFVFIGWTNTLGNMPAWGALDTRLGNNPIVFAIPYQQEAIVLDMAMSQYSFGALELQKFQNKTLPVPGGFDTGGTLSMDPGAIMASNRVLPVGYWKGAGMSLLLDILATILSGGLSVSAISKQPAEINLSQVFIAIDLSKIHNFKTVNNVVHQIIHDYVASTPAQAGGKITYPGERVLLTREENSKHGIPVLKKVWDEVMNLAAE